MFVYLEYLNKLLFMSNEYHNMALAKIDAFTKFANVTT